VVERRYPAGKSAQALASEWSQRFKRAKIRAERNQVVVLARIEEHEQLARAAIEQRPATVVDGIDKVRIDRLSLVRLPVGAVLENLAKRLGLELHFDQPAIDRAGIKLDKLVTVNVENASIDEMLRATLEGAQLTFKRTGRRVDVFPLGN
jgi:hypothetical protein